MSKHPVIDLTANNSNADFLSDDEPIEINPAPRKLIRTGAKRVIDLTQSSYLPRDPSDEDIYSDDDLEQDSDELIGEDVIEEQLAGKQPMVGPHTAMWSDQPDLEQYFSQWMMPDKDIIVMCRAYASYLARKPINQRKK